MQGKGYSDGEYHDGIESDVEMATAASAPGAVAIQSAEEEETTKPPSPQTPHRTTRASLSSSQRTTLENLPRPALRSRSHTVEATQENRGNIGEATPLLRSSSRSSAATQRVLTRTSLERLPLPPGPALSAESSPSPPTLPRRSTRAGAGAEGGGEGIGSGNRSRNARASGSSSSGAAAAVSRTSSELMALLGLDAAVRQTAHLKYSIRY